MAVKSVPTLGWTRGSVAATILLVTQQQRDAVAARVRAEMAQRGWTNSKLAREADLSEKTISRLINGRKDARLDTLERVARALGVPESKLRGEQPAPLALGPTQLDRMEAKLDELLDIVNGRKPGDVDAEVAEILDDVVDRAREEAESRQPPAADPPAIPRAARPRRSA